MIITSQIFLNGWSITIQEYVANPHPITYTIEAFLALGCLWCTKWHFMLHSEKN